MAVVAANVPEARPRGAGVVRPRHRRGWRAALAPWVGAIVALGFYAWAFTVAWPDGVAAGRRSTVTVAEGEGVPEDIVLTVPFGYGRRPLTRTVQVDLCDIEVMRGDPDCQEVTTGDAPRTRSEILNVALTRDPESGRGRQFPATQLAVTAENVGQSSIAISVAADPLEPERIDWGDYAGTIQIDRAPADLTVRLRLELTDKSSLTPLVLLVLGGGAAAGVAVKWVGQSLPTMATVRRRRRRIEARLRAVWGYLPDDVAERLAEIDVDLQSADAQSAAAEVALIEGHVQELRRIGFLATAFATEQRRHVDLTNRLGQIAQGPPSPAAAAPPAVEAQSLLEDLVAIERPFLGRVLSAPWLWAQPAQRLSSDALAEQVSRSREVCRSAELYLESPDSSSRLERLQNAVFLAMSELDEVPGHAPPPAWRVDDPPSRTREIESPPPDGHSEVSRSWRTPMEVIADHARLLAFVVTLLVTVALGYWSQFETQSAFVGDLRDVVALALWAFAVQVSGVTVLETVGSVLPGSSDVAGGLDAVSSQVHSSSSS